VIGRILRSKDFERVLGSTSRARSPHFAVHHLIGEPSRPGPAALAARASDPQLALPLPPALVELSTGEPAPQSLLVDDSSAQGCWLGMVVPKRHARRAVTRNLIKRQIKNVAELALLASSSKVLPGLWVVRLRAPFDRAQFLSPGSDVLRDAVSQELDAVLRQAARRVEGV
jgi:ribonuclease P protein component